MKIKLADDAPEKVISFYFYENEEFCSKVKEHFGVTIIPTLDRNAFDPRDTMEVIKMSKIKFGCYDHFLVKHFDIDTGDEPLGFIMFNMFNEFMAAENIKRGDVIVGLGIFELASIVDPLTLGAKKIFFLRGLINHEINDEYAKLIQAESEVA